MPSPIGPSTSPTTIARLSPEGGAAPEPVRTSSPPTITIPPVYVQGQAESAQRLIQAHDASKAARGCVAEAVTAGYGALGVVGAVGGAVLGTALIGPVGVAVGLAGVSAVSFDEGQKLRALYNCATE